MVPSQTPDVQGPRRSRRPAISCTLCHKRKIRCNRAKPCSSCLRSKSGAAGCVYESAMSHHPTPSNVEPLQVQPRIESSDGSLVMGTPNQYQQIQETQFRTSTPHSSNAARSSSTTYPSFSSSLAAISLTGPSTPVSASGQSARSSEEVRLRLRIEELESRLSTQLQSQRCQNSAPASCPPLPPARTLAADSNMETISSRLGGTFHVLSLKNDTSSQDQPHVAHNLSLKTRLFGQSHWAVSTTPLVRFHPSELLPRGNAIELTHRSIRSVTLSTYLVNEKMQITPLGLA
jgi:hypothetical protein